MCDFLGDSSEGSWGSAVIRWALSLAAHLPGEEGREEPGAGVPLKLKEAEKKQVTGREAAGGEGREQTPRAEREDGEAGGAEGEARGPWRTPQTRGERWDSPEGKR